MISSFIIYLCCAAINANLEANFKSKSGFAIQEVLHNFEDWYSLPFIQYIRDIIPSAKHFIRTTIW